MIFCFREREQKTLFQKVDAYAQIQQIPTTAMGLNQEQLQIRYVKKFFICCNKSKKKLRSKTKPQKLLRIILAIKIEIGV